MIKIPLRVHLTSVFGHFTSTMEAILPLIADTLEQNWPKTEVVTEVIKACRGVNVDFRNLNVKIDLQNIKAKLDRLEEQSDDKAEVQKFKGWVDTLQRRLIARNKLTETMLGIIESDDSVQKDEHFRDILAVISRITQHCDNFGIQFWLPQILNQ